MKADSNLEELLESVEEQPIPRKSGIAATTGFSNTFQMLQPSDLITSYPSSPCQWGTDDDVKFTPQGKTVNRLIPSYYDIFSTPNGIYFEKLPLKTEGLIEFPDSVSKKIVDEVVDFWGKESLFKQYNIAFRRSLLLYGNPATGKSSTINLAMRDVIARGGVVIKFVSPYLFSIGFRILRQIQPDSPVVVLMEDVDSIIEENSESEILNILDGVEKFEKVLFIATTNYPEKLGKRIINRPSRFDKRFEMQYPNSECRRIYLEHLIGQNEMSLDLDKWVNETKDFSLAHLKELFVTVVILGNSYSESLNTLVKMKYNVSSTSEVKAGLRG